MNPGECVKVGAGILDVIYPNWAKDYYDEFRNMDDSHLITQISLFFADMIKGAYLDNGTEHRLGIRPKKINLSKTRNGTAEQFLTSSVLGWTKKDIAYFAKLWRGETTSRYQKNTVNSK